LNRFHLLLITSKAAPYAFVMCGEMRAEHCGRLFHLNIRWLTRKDPGWREWPAQCTGATLLNDLSTSWLPNILNSFFVRLDQINSSMHGKGKILFDVSKTIAF